jgi:hypothetical protein
MNPASRRLVPGRRLSPLAVFLALGLAACVGSPDLDSGSDPLVVTEAGAVSYAPEQSAERAAAVAEMRARAEAGDLLPYPDAFQGAQAARLAARPEPYSVPEAETIEAELAAIARQRAATTDPAEIAALQARAEELRRLAAARRR